MMNNTPLLLLIFDGWGLRTEETGNAITLAQPSYYEQLLQRYPWRVIEASGEPVGLPDGQMGNSEVGHMNMGAGRIVYQELTRINKSIRDGDFFENPVLLNAMAQAKTHGTTLHLMGLVSDGGVHSDLPHLQALISMAKMQGVENLRVHAFLDGRDVPPRSAEAYLRSVEETLLEHDYPQIATIIGRYYAMDRDNRWERVQLAYDNLVSAKGAKHMLSINGLKFAYHQDQNDEFVPPMVTDLSYEGMADGDSVIFFNFRPDRARQITEALTSPNFAGFARERVVNNLHFACMTLYDDRFPLPVAYPKQKLDCILAEVLAEHGVRQLRTAETEKYAHVTFFFNGGFEPPFPGEDRKLVPSPKVATYDMQPEMSLPKVAQGVVEAVESGQYDFIVANFANPDMVGHTGKLPAAIDAVKAVDDALKQVTEAVLNAGGVMLLTADHGNIEQMINETGGEHTAHTTDPVPLVLVSQDARLKLKETGEYSLSSISPTVLELLGLNVPPQMTSPSMLAPASVPV
jgi:2,3-bisphosphoglycerate-independent phosphoglycerate mutase